MGKMHNWHQDAPLAGALTYMPPEHHKSLKSNPLTPFDSALRRRQLQELEDSPRSRPPQESYPGSMRRALDSARVAGEYKSTPHVTLLSVLDRKRVPVKLGKRIDPLMLSPRAQEIQREVTTVETKAPGEVEAWRQNLSLFDDKKWYLFPQSRTQPGGTVGEMLDHPRTLVVAAMPDPEPV